MMDVDRVFYHVAAKDNDNTKLVAYMRQVGAAGSAFEHAVPERLFADPTKPLNDPSQPQGVSAVKAIAIAASQGQKIYTLNQQNQAMHSMLLAQVNIDADARQEIQDALAVGNEVTVHASPINQYGLTASGYIILDPHTGAGAYKISGGANGAIILIGAILIMLQIMLAFVATSAAILAIGGALALVAGILLGLSLSDDPMALASFAGARLYAAIATVVLLVVVEGFVILPLAALVGSIIATIAALVALINVFIKSTAIPNDIDFLDFKRRTCIA